MSDTTIIELTGEEISVACGEYAVKRLRDGAYDVRTSLECFPGKPPAEQFKVTCRCTPRREKTR